MSNAATSHSGPDGMASGAYVSGAAPVAPRVDLDALCAGVREKVEAFTRRVFGSEVVLRRESDPEFPAEYYTVSVQAAGDVPAVLAQNDRWHRQLREIAGNLAHYFRLSLDTP